MCDSRRYRSNASECLLASYEARQPCQRFYNISNFPQPLSLTESESRG
jgi:hypothetical protein